MRSFVAGFSDELAKMASSITGQDHPLAATRSRTAFGAPETGGPQNSGATLLAPFGHRPVDQQPGQPHHHEPEKLAGATGKLRRLAIAVERNAWSGKGPTVDSPRLRRLMLREATRGIRKNPLRMFPELSLDEVIDYEDAWRGQLGGLPTREAVVESATRRLGKALSASRVSRSLEKTVSKANYPYAVGATLFKTANDPIKKRMTCHGIGLGIEWPKGSTRKYYSKSDPKKVNYEKLMKADYGYISGTKDHDGEQLDAYVGPNPKSTKVFVIKQLKDDGSFDEHKVMLGYDDLAAAKKSYLDHMPAKRLGKIEETDIDTFKAEHLEKAREMRKAADFCVACVRGFSDEMTKVALRPMASYPLAGAPLGAALGAGLGWAFAPLHTGYSKLTKKEKARITRNYAIGGAVAGGLTGGLAGLGMGLEEEEFAAVRKADNEAWETSRRARHAREAAEDARYERRRREAHENTRRANEEEARRAGQEHDDFWERFNARFGGGGGSPRRRGAVGEWPSWLPRDLKTKREAKAVFRAEAMKVHPDLTTSEAEKARRGPLMTKINNEWDAVRGASGQPHPDFDKLAYLRFRLAMHEIAIEAAKCVDEIEKVAMPAGQFRKFVVSWIENGKRRSTPIMAMSARHALKFSFGDIFPRHALPSVRITRGGQVLEKAAGFLRERIREGGGTSSDPAEGDEFMQARHLARLNAPAVAPGIPSMSRTAAKQKRWTGAAGSADAFGQQSTPKGADEVAEPMVSPSTPADAFY